MVKKETVTKNLMEDEFNVVHVHLANPVLNEVHVGQLIDNSESFRNNRFIILDRMHDLSSEDSLEYNEENMNGVVAKSSPLQVVSFGVR